MEPFSAEGPNVDMFIGDAKLNSAIPGDLFFWRAAPNFSRGECAFRFLPVVGEYPPPRS
jgi:hypothetical protein